MKKIISLFLAAVFMVACVYAEEPSVFIDKVVDNGEFKQTVIIKGKDDCGSKTMVGLVIKNSAGEIKVLKQIDSESDGSYQFNISLKETGDFLAFINTTDYNFLTVKPFQLKSEQEYRNIIEYFNLPETTEDDYVSHLNAHQNDLGFDGKYYTGRESDVAKFLINYKGQLTLENFDTKFSLASLYSVLSGDDVEIMKEALQYYNGLLSFEDSTAANIFNVTSDENAIKAALNSVAGYQSEDVVSVVSNIEKELLKKNFSMLELEELDSLIRNNEEVFNFTDYNNLSVTRAKSILLQMKNNTSLTTLQSYIDFYNAVYNIPVVEPSAGQIGSGGGGGGGGNYVIATPPKEVETENDIPVNETPEVEYINFSDINSVPWAKEAILNLADKKIVCGKSADKFCPSDNVTRAEFVKLIVEVFGCHNSSLESDFSDISSTDWYSSYVASAVANSLVSGRDNNTFGGNDKIKREDMAVIAYRAIISFKAMDETTSITNNIADFSEISDYARNSVLMLFNMGIMSGKGDGIFAPKALATRAEACVMINNILEGMK